MFTLAFFTLGLLSYFCPLPLVLPLCCQFPLKVNCPLPTPWNPDPYVAPLPLPLPLPLPPLPLPLPLPWGVT